MKLKLVRRHYGPGLHPKTGTPQLIHSHAGAFVVPHAPVVIDGQQQLPDVMAERFLQDEFGAWWDKQSPAQKTLLGDYASFKYNTMNRGLRGDAKYRGKFDPAEVAALDSVLTHELSRDVIIYRGVGNEALPGARVGGTVVDRAYTSTSLLFHIAAAGTEFAQGNVLQMVIPKGTKCGIVTRPGVGVEAEILLPRGARFEISNIGAAGGRSYVTLKLRDFAGKQPVETLPPKEASTKKAHTPAEDEWDDPRYFDL